MKALFNWDFRITFPFCGHLVFLICRDIWITYDRLHTQLLHSVRFSLQQLLFRMHIQIITSLRPWIQISPFVTFLKLLSPVTFPHYTCMLEGSWNWMFRQSSAFKSYVRAKVETGTANGKRDPPRRLKGETQLTQRLHSPHRVRLSADWNEYFP